MSFSNIGFDNLFFDGFNAITFSLFGMALVFAGLIIIALYIIALPKLLNEKKKKPEKVNKGSASLDEENAESEILLAIACAYHLERTSLSGNDKITLKQDLTEESQWQVSGRLERLAARQQQSSWR